jgi:hypothetical protein
MTLNRPECSTNVSLNTSIIISVRRRNPNKCELDFLGGKMGEAVARVNAIWISSWEAV